MSQDMLVITDPADINFCCGSLCPKEQVQERIDRMQRAIDTAHQLMNYGDLPEDIAVGLKLELKHLSSK